MSPSSLFSYAIEWPVALAWHVYAMLVRLTSNVTISGDVPSEPAIFVNWHRYQAFLIPHHGAYRRCMLVSPVPALAPVARFCRLSGLQLIRGASGERGQQAREELAARVSAGGAITMAVDGPAGPVFQAKRGCAEIALRTHAPIVPVRFHCRRDRTLEWRWDKMLVPLPFDRITIAYGAPITGSEEAELLEKVEKGLAALEAV